MDMSENDFYLLQGNSYRGSRYGNFAGGGVTPQGNVSSAITENDASQVGTSADAAQRGISSEQPSDNSNAEPELPSFGAKEVVAAGLPFAGNVIGQTAGAAIGGGATFSEGLSEGASYLANKVSGGLIGSAGAGAAATNSAISSSLGGASGPATKAAVTAASDKAVGTLGSSANIGAAAGAGLGAAAATLLTGGSIGDAAKSGAGTAIGTAIGSSFGPVGAFIGGTIGGSIFCFAAGTPILMGDGTQKLVEELKIGDDVLCGGEVVAFGQSRADGLYEYKNTIVTGKHSVFENGKWIRVENSEFSKEYVGDLDLVYPICTETNLLITPWFIGADVIEIPLEEADGMTYEQIIESLNSQTERNEFLAAVEKEVCKA